MKGKNMIKHSSFVRCALLSVGFSLFVPICRNTTVQSLICELAPNVTNTVLHMTVGRPCEKPYGVYRPFASQLPDDTVHGDEALERLTNYNLPVPERR